MRSQGIIRNNKYGFVYIAVLFSLLLSARMVSAQELPVSKEEIYRNAYKTALANGNISGNERAMLKTIQNTLRLSDHEVTHIVSQIQVDPGYIDQSGRWLLVAQNMIYGASVYGWMIPDVLGVKEHKYYIGSEMISLAGSFYLTYIYTKNIELSHSRAQMIRLGSLLGLRLGFAANTIFELDRDSRKAWELSVMAAIPVGAYVGDHLFKRWQPSHGQSWTLSLGAGIGAFSTSLLHSAFDQMPEEPDTPENMNWEEWEKSGEYRSWERKHDKWRRLNTVIELAGYPVGMYLARQFWRDKDHSVGDALMLTQGAVSGAFYGLLSAQLFGLDFDNSKWHLFPVAGVSLATILMDNYIDGYNYSAGQGLVSILGTVSGIAFMAGLCVMTEIENEKVLSAGLIAGGISGLYLTNKIFNLEKEKAGNAADKDLSLMITPSVQIQRKDGNPVPGFSLVAIF